MHINVPLASRNLTLTMQNNMIFSQCPNDNGSDSRFAGVILSAISTFFNQDETGTVPFGVSAVHDKVHEGANQVSSRSVKDSSEKSESR